MSAALPSLDKIFSNDAALQAGGLSAFLDSSPVATYVIDSEHVVRYWNKACEHMTGIHAASIVGTRDQWKPFYAQARPVLADLIVSQKPPSEFLPHYQEKCRPSSLVSGSYEAEDFFPGIGEHGIWLLFSAAPLHDGEGRIVGAIETLQDITSQKNTEQHLQRVRVALEQQVSDRLAQLAEDIQKRKDTEAELLRRNKELMELNDKLSKAQEQLVQSDKLASIGQLAAGVAHEINNPIGYVFSNFGSLENYLCGLFEVLESYEDAEESISSAVAKDRVREIKARVELDFLKQDIPSLMRESKDGIARVRKIVQDLKDFSRVDTSQEWQWANLNQGIDSTLNIVNNEIKYKADVVKEYGDIPDVECLPTQINQVVMNLLVNASHAMGQERGTITVRTGKEAEKVWIEVADNGQGISKENLSRIFDPFFTTKPVGKGTGLGLSLSYGIVQKHQGCIEVRSDVGVGTTFRITLPVRQSAAGQESEGR
jgi:PAS domain S-box-containing protein